MQYLMMKSWNRQWEWKRFIIILFSSTPLYKMCLRTEWFIDRQVCLNYEHWSSRSLCLFKYMTSSSIEHSINTTNGIFRTLKVEHGRAEHYHNLKFIWNNSQSGYFLLLCTPARKIYVLIWRNNVTPLSNPLKCAKPFSFMNRRKWRENKKLDKMPHNVARLFSKVINIFKSQIAESSKWCFAFKIW